MPLDTIREMDRCVSENREYAADRQNTNQQVAIHRLNLIGLNIAKVLMDIKEDSENHKLMYEDCKLLQILSEDMNDCVIFMNNEILNKKIKYSIYIYNAQVYVITRYTTPF